MPREFDPVALWRQGWNLQEISMEKDNTFRCESCSTDFYCDEENPHPDCLEHRFTICAECGPDFIDHMIFSDDEHRTHPL